MLIRFLGAMLAIALVYIPAAEAGKSQRELFTPQTEKQRKFTCTLGVLIFGIHPACFVGKIKAQGKAKVTIHKPVQGTCPNGNTYRIMRVSDPAHVCKNSLRGGHAVPACTNISGRNGNAYSIIILGRSDRWLAHEIRHACDVNWNH